MKLIRTWMPLFIWSSAVLFYMYQFLLRVSPSVMMDDLMRDFQIDASGFGALSALAMYCYSITQIPLGILSDLFGARKTILLSLILCILGTLVFAHSKLLVTAQLGRILLGTGSAAAFLCVNKITREWLPPEKTATFLGLILTAGTIGALNGGAPLAVLNSSYGWRQTLVWLSMIGGFIFFLNFLILKETPLKSKEKYVPVQFWHLMRNSQCWIYATVAFGSYLSIVVFADLWGTSFLCQLHPIDKTTASLSVSWIYIGLCIGSPTLAWITQIFRKRKLIITLSILMLLVFLSTLIFFCKEIELSYIKYLFFLIGFFSGVEMLCFAGAFDATSTSAAGTVTGFINTVVMLSGAVVQQQIGKLLDLFWSGEISSNGIRVYSILSYQKALSSMILLMCFSMIASFFIRETPSLEQNIASE